MIQEDKLLLLKDLCTRLPYGVQAIGEYEEEASYSRPFDGLKKSIGHVDGIDHIGFDNGEIYVTIEGIPCELSGVKLYLNPMSSMTIEERKEWFKYSHVKYDCEFKPEPTLLVDHCHLSIDWLNAHHFDYYGLIKKGLALEAPEGMYKID